MKWRYLKVTGSLIWAAYEITKDDLVRTAQGQYDTIIDLVDGTKFNAEENQWEKIEGDEA